MVAVVTGNGLGLERSSVALLGSRGMLGGAVTGRSGDNVYVNAANGNLVVQRTDEMLIGLGPDDVIARAYNSKAASENWRVSAQRKVSGLQGTVNTAGSTVTRTDWDGSEVVYTWSTSRNAYVATDGAGAYDTLTYASNVWTWTDGNSLVVEHYDNANGGRIVNAVDNSGNTLSYSYNAAGQVSRVTTADGYYTDLVYTGGLLTQIVTAYKPGDEGGVTTLTRTRYGYDASNRLTTVTVDLSPNDNSISDGKTYVTTYTYDGTSQRIASIGQSDGSLLQITYVQPTAGDYRVATLTETISSGVTRVTSFSYDTVNRTTTVTDPNGQVTSLVYDALGQLTQITAPPATSGAAAQVSTFAYNANGDVTSVTAGGNTVNYSYDANGNCTVQSDPLGNMIQRTYTAAGQLATEARFTMVGGSYVTTVLRSYYFYDAANKLVFSVSNITAAYSVTAYEYDAYGRLTGQLELAADGVPYTVQSLPTLSSVTTWYNALANKSAGVRTDTTYDFRGNVASITQYGKLLASGQGDTSDPAEVSRTDFIYDQAGNLLNRVTNDGAGDPENDHPHETFVYDGLGRLVASTDLRGKTTSVTFNDAARQTIITFANGLVQTSVYDAVGDLLSFTSSGASAGQGASVSTFVYDKLGRLLVETDPTGLKTQHIYDNLGRKVADLASDGSVVEYIYNDANLLARAIHYKTKPTAAQISAAAGSPTTATIAALRPATDAVNDQWQWRVYDISGRLVELIDASGAVTEYIYDTGLLIASTKQYATRLDIAALKATPPTTKVLPTASAATDRLTRNFYDGAGRLIGVLDAEGYLTQMVFDRADRLIETIRYATAAAVDWTTSTFTQLQASVASGALAANDIHERAVYDGQNRLRATIDGEGDIVRYEYTAAGDVRQEIRGQKLASGVAATLANVVAAAASGAIETTTYNRGFSGLVSSMVRTLTGGATETTVYSYDAVGNVISAISSSSQSPSDTREANRVYDLRGRLVRELSGEGSARLAALGENATTAQVDAIYASFGTRYVYDDADRLIARYDPNGVDGGGLRTLYYYDAAGRLTHTINALGEVTERVYDSLGRQTDTIVHGVRIASGTLATLTGGLVNATLTNAVAAIVSASVDSTIHVDYDARNLATLITDPMGATTSYAYNAFGEQTGSTRQLDATTSVLATRTYDRRGLLLTSTFDAASGGLQLATTYGYDAFGRVLQVTDPRGQANATTYDRAGRVLTQTDAAGKIQTFTYDARGNVLTSTDRNGATTSYSYTAFNRSVTVSTPEGVITTTVLNAYGQTVSVTDGAGRVVTYAYDKNGALKITTDAAGMEVRDYDQAGRLADVIDANGIKTSYTYDAADRVLTRKVDDGGLNLVTQYAYDAKGQQVSVTDPKGLVTTISYDKAGRQTSVVADSTGLAISTVYTYDKGGRVLTVTQASGTAAAVVTKYTYDNADRRTKTEVDPSGKDLTTSYVYNAVGDVTAVTDAAGKITRYGYGVEHRVIWEIDPTGSVTGYTYDGEGRVASIRRYASQVPAATLATLPTNGTAGSGGVSTSASDEVTTYLYDGDGRLRYVLDASLRPIKYIYDGAGNVIRTMESERAIPASGSGYTTASVDAALTALNLTAADKRVTRTVYDGANRAVFSIDALGLVTAYTYDAAGNVVKTRRYETAYVNAADPTNTLDPSLATLQAWSAGLNATQTDDDRISRTLYDGAGRPVYAVDAENYVTETQYDAAGRITKSIRYAARYTVTDTTTRAGLAALIGSLTGTAVVTSYAYDSAGRLTDVTNGVGVVTHMVLDAQGRVTDQTVAYGTSDASTTHFVYDGGGRVTSRTDAYGKAEATTTTYTYDGMGRVLTQTDGRGYTTTRSYDADGRVVQITVPLDATHNAVTTNQYDAFGNLVKVTDPLGNVGYFYYDGLNQLVFQVDPEGFGVRTEYSTGGEVTKVTRYAVRTTGAAVGVLPSVATSGQDEVTTITRDKLDRVMGVIDAENKTESYILNAFGDRVAIINKLSATTTYVYDKRGLVLSETLPISATRSNGTVEATSVTNTYEYDARGNRTKSVEAAGLSEQRTTLYAYDKLNRLVQETGDAVQVLSADLSTFTSVTPTSTITYDLRGNIVQTVDQAGSRTTSWFDALNRKVSQVDGVGTLRTWTYDAAGNITSERTYADAVAITPSVQTGSWTPDVVVEGHYAPDFYLTDIVSTGYDGYYDSWGSGSGTSYAYNAAGDMGVWDGVGYLAAGHWIPTSVTPGGYSGGSYSVSAGTYTALSPTDPKPNPTGAYREKIYTYDRNNRQLTATLAGQLVNLPSQGTQLTTADLTAQTVYDAAGNVVQMIDANGASIFSFYDKLGRKVAGVDQENYLTSYTLDGDGNVLTEERFATRLSGTVSITDNPATLKANVAKTADDRVTVFTYDRNGRRLTEQRTNVASYTVSGTGALSTGATSAVITYAYDGLGNVTRKTEATGDYIDYAYDGLGRQTSATTSAFTDYLGASVRTMTEMRYDGLNNLVTSTVRNSAGTSASDRTTAYVYGAGGRLASVTDATGFTRTYAYDLGGRVLRESYVRVKSDGTSVAEANAYRYDQLGRVISQAVASYGSSWTLGDQTQVKYNAFGEVVAKGVNGGWQEKFDYDSGGRMWRSTASDGVIKIYVYDGVGNATQTFTSAGADLSGQSVQSVRNLLTNNGVNVLGSIMVAGVNLTFNAYDKRGEQTSTTEAMRQLTIGGSATNLVTSKSYNAFGEVTTETDARSYTTTFLYNTLGKLVQKRSPQTSSTSESGVTSNVVPIDNYYYDLSGRLIGVADANGNRTTRQLLVGSGYGGDDAVVLAEFHADYSVSRVAVDVYGDERKFTNELGYVEMRDYDKMSRVLTVTHPTRVGIGTLQDYYTYDGLGQLLTHANSQFGASVKETTDYDLQGRVIKTVSYAADITTYSYAYNGALATTGTGVFGGWTKISNYAGGKMSIDRTDYFGRTIEHIDQGGHLSTYTFDAAGRILSQNGSGRTLAYTYFNTGKVATLTDTSQTNVTAVSTYGYDANGNRTIEKYSATSSSGSVSFQNATSTYDGLGRLTSVVDSGFANSRPVTITYAYDNVGNMRRMSSVYTAVDGTGNQVQDYWYKYDSMNRFVTTKGALSNGVIVRGMDGTEITYDAAGNRATATTSIAKQEWVSTWVPEVTIPAHVVPGHYAVAHYINQSDIVQTWSEAETYDSWGAALTNREMAKSRDGEIGQWDGAGYLVPEQMEWIPGAITPGYTVQGHYDSSQVWIDGYTIPAHQEPGHYEAWWVPAATTQAQIIPGHYEQGQVWIPGYTVPASQQPGHYENQQVWIPGYTVPASQGPGHWENGHYLTGIIGTDIQYDGPDSWGNYQGYPYAWNAAGETGWWDGTGYWVYAQTWVPGETIPAYDVPGYWTTQQVWVEGQVIPAYDVPGHYETGQVWVPQTSVPGRTIAAHASYAHYMAYDEIAYTDHYYEYPSYGGPGWGGYDYAVSVTGEEGIWDGTGYWIQQQMVYVAGPITPAQYVPGHYETIQTWIPTYTVPDQQGPGHWQTKWVPDTTIPATTIPGYYTNGWQNYTAARTEHYTYTEDGYLLSTTVNESKFDGSWTAQVTEATDIRDMLGRTIQHAEYLSDGSTLAYSRYAAYDTRSNVTYDSTTTRGSDGVYTYTTTNYTYLEGGGPIAVSASASTRNNQTTNTRTATSYAWWDSAVVSSVSYTTQTNVSTTTWSTYYTYDRGGNLASASIYDGFPRTMTYVTDAMGQVMMRQDTAGYNYGTSGVQAAIAQGAAAINAARPVELYYYFNNLRVGDVGNDGVGKLDYAASIAARSASHTPGQVFNGYGPQPKADFDQSYDPISPTSQGDAATSYTARAGDTLSSIAASLWGDSSLWYLIAEANGLSGPDAVAAGMRLVIPNKVANLHNNSATFRPYDPNQALGETAPTDAPAPVAAAPSKKKGCGIVGQILMVVVAVVVTVVTYGALTGPTTTMFGAIAAGAVAGAAGSIASQLVGIATGNQDKFSWKSVALAAVTQGVTKGLTKFSALSNLTKGMSAVEKAVTQSVASSVISQSIGVVTGLQDKFSWTNVAVAGVTAGVSTAVGGVSWLQGDPDSFRGIANGLISGAAGAVAGAAAQSLMDGSDFGDNIRSALPAVAGNTIGNAIAFGLEKQYAAAKKAKAAAAAATPAPAATTAPSADDYAGFDGFYVRDSDGTPDYNRYLMAPEGEHYVTTGGARSAGAAATDANYSGGGGKRSLWNSIKGFFRDPLGTTSRAVQSLFKGKTDYTTSDHTNNPPTLLDQAVTQLETIIVIGRRQYEAVLWQANQIYDTAARQTKMDFERRASNLVALPSAALWGAGSLADRAGFHGVGNELRRQAVILPNLARGGAGSLVDLTTGTVKTGLVFAYNASPLGTLNGALEMATGHSLPGPNANVLSRPIANRIGEYVSGERSVGDDIASAFHGEVESWRGIAQRISSDDLSQVASGSYDLGHKTVDYGVTLVPLAGEAAKGAQFLRALSAGERVLVAADVVAETVAPNVDKYVAGLYSKATPTSTKAGLFEVEQTGSLNYRVVGGNTAVDIDGYAGAAIQEAKYVGNAAKSPYVGGSEIPEFLRAKILTEQQHEFARLGAVIADPAVPFTSLNVLTNEAKAVPYFQELMDANKIPGKVVVVPTKVH